MQRSRLLPRSGHAARRRLLDCKWAARMPLPTARVAPLGPHAPRRLGCFYAEGALLDGNVVGILDGVGSPEACCRACRELGSSNCSVWNYCANAAGCRWGWAAGRGRTQAHRRPAAAWALPPWCRAASAPAALLPRPPPLPSAARLAQRCCLANAVCLVPPAAVAPTGIPIWSIISICGRGSASCATITWQPKWGGRPA